jgi:dTDP-4-dehydrorhamnose 3,5-epimerase
MKVVKAEIPDVLIITPDVYRDDRGYFLESYNSEAFSAAGLTMNFVQDNESLSRKGVLRGMHFQNPPFEQGKLVRVVKGAVMVVAVDLRKNSPYYGKWCSAILTEENKLLFWLPPGFAHGFLTLEENTVFSYKCTQVYNRESEECIIWNDPDLKITWPEKTPIITDRDRNGKRFKDFNSRFIY